MFYLCILYTLFGKMLERIFFRIIDIKPYIRTYPDISFFILIKCRDEIISYTPLTTVIVLKFTE